MQCLESGAPAICKRESYSWGGNEVGVKINLNRKSVAKVKSKSKIERKGENDTNSAGAQKVFARNRIFE